MKKTDYKKEIIKEIDAAATHTDRRIVFSDFCRAMALALESQTAKAIGDLSLHRAVEAEYMSHIERYKDGNAATHIAKALALVVASLDETHHDILGHVYEELNATNKRFGQYFTPDDVSRVMSRLTLEGTKPEPGRIVTMNDCACGAGALLIEGAQSFLDKGGRQGDIMIYAEDIDQTAADIAYIQLFFLGFPARVTRMNSLTLQGGRPRFTMGYYLHHTEARLAVQKRHDAEG